MYLESRTRVVALGAFAVLVLALLMLGLRQERGTVLEQLRKDGELHVLTRTGATTFYEGPFGPTGFEYDLAKRFADHLGVTLRITVAASTSEALARLARGEAHLAAAGLTVTPEREQSVRFTPPYQHITQQVVYRRGMKAPKSLADLAAGDLEVAANSSHAAQLRLLHADHPALAWREHAELETEELLTLVRTEVIDYTVVDSHELALTRRFYPELRVGFDLSAPQPLAWALPLNQDDSLYEEAVAFLEQVERNGELAHLLDRHYGHTESYDYAGTPIYLRHINQRLPQYRELFEQAAAENNLDWRLLAAMGYQESHWDPSAVSPTGVRGMMMLTRATAEFLGIEQRTDVTQSIRGGARYLRTLLDRVPPEIAEPDRTWLAVAAYNVGWGHVEDVRQITAELGGDPNKWTDVKRNLPLLRLKKWYSRTRHGYARGHEPVRYVENIRSYYDILTYITVQEMPQQPVIPKALFLTSPVL